MDAQESGREEGYSAMWPGKISGLGLITGKINFKAPSSVIILSF